LNQIDNQHDERHHQQKMDQAAANVTDEAKKPEHNQDDNYGPKHGVFLSVWLNSGRVDGFHQSGKGNIFLNMGGKYPNQAISRIH
jgi:hypothetical protein